MMLIDSQKVFDTVGHGKLLQKLGVIGLSDDSVLWLKSYLSNHIQYVDVNRIRWDPGEITCGVPPGSILGPLLLLINVNSMVSAVYCELFLYADASAQMISGKITAEIT